MGGTRRPVKPGKQRSSVFAFHHWAGLFIEASKSVGCGGFGCGDALRNVRIIGPEQDVRWIGQTYAESHVIPSARVVEVGADRIGCEIEVEGEDRSLLRGKMILPLPAAGP